MPGYTEILLVSAIVVSGFLIFDNESALACSCVSNTLEEHIEAAEAIFEGEVDKIDIENEGQRVTFKAEQAWKGVSGAKVTITSYFAGLCSGRQFEVGEKYLVYAYGEPEKLGVSLCTRTMVIEDAQADIDILGPGYVPADKSSDLVYGVDSGVGPLPVIFGIGAAVAAVIAFMTLRRGMES